MASRKRTFICASLLAAGLAFAPMTLRAQSASDCGHAAEDVGENPVQSTEHAFHRAADDPILIERAKSALAHEPMTRNQPIIVSANNGVVIRKAGSHTRSAIARWRWHRKSTAPGASRTRCCTTKPEFARSHHGSFA